MNKSSLLLLGILVSLVYLIAMQVDVMDVDAGQYATMSMQMAKSNSFLEIYDRDAAYLDKPPLLFWVNAISMKIFGFTNFAFKLPSVLASLLAVFSVFKLARLFYKKETAILAAIITATAQATIFTCNDVRTDNLLIGFTTFAVWQLVAFIQNNKWKNLILGSVGVGFAMLAKGPLGIMLPGAIIGGQLLVKKDFKGIFNWKWIVLPVIVAIVLLPMCIGLYNQWDAHPELVQVHAGEARTNVSGLKFFFWEQSFGRITGENKWSNNPDPLFLVHTFAWAFLPWTILFLSAFYAKVKELFRNKFKVLEVIGILGYIVPTIALSLSKYQLPHYIFIAVPFASLLVADYLTNLLSNEKVEKVLERTQYVISFLLIVFVIFVSEYMFDTPVWVYFVTVALLVFSFRVLRKLQSRWNFILMSAVFALIANFVLHASFYPNLLSYQGPSVMGKYVQQNGMADKTIMFTQFGRAQDFYAQTVLPYTGSTPELIDAIKSKKYQYVYCHESVVETLKSFGFKVTVQKEIPHYSVQLLKPEFINPNTRDSVLISNCLVKVE